MLKVCDCINKSWSESLIQATLHKDMRTHFTQQASITHINLQTSFECLPIRYVCTAITLTPLSSKDRSLSMEQYTFGPSSQWFMKYSKVRVESPSSQP